MYEIYFHKKELKDDNFIESFNTKLNKSSYKDITSNDPFWWEDEGLLKRLWDTEYNYVESKYLGIGISYSLTEILYENILLIKAIMDNKEKFKEITLKRPSKKRNSDEMHSNPYNLFELELLLFFDILL